MTNNTDPLNAISEQQKTSPDPVVEANREMLLQRSLVGLKKYGVTLEDGGLSLRERLLHALEEVLDLSNYMQAAIRAIDAGALSPKSQQAQAGEAERHVDLPERVIDQLWQQAGLTCFHPDGSQLDKFYAFALNVRDEVLARLPNSLFQPQPQAVVSDDTVDEREANAIRKMEQKFTLPELVGNLQCLVREPEAAFNGFGPEWAAGLAKEAIELLEEYSDTLRGLAYSVSAGGFNSEGLMSPRVGEEKIRWGIDHLMQVEERRRASLAQPTVAAEQEPVATLHDDGHWTWKGTPPHESNYAGWRMEVFAHPAAVQRDEQQADAGGEGGK